MILLRFEVRHVEVSESDGLACIDLFQSLDYGCLIRMSPTARKDTMGLSETTLIRKFRRKLTKIEGCLSPGELEPRGATMRATAPGPVVLLGAPGVGKGTQADALAKIWRIPKISTGEILRTNVTDGTALGIQADETMQRGGLVPNQVITEMVASRLSISDASGGFILDGFPRTVEQAQWLDGHLAGRWNSTSLTIISMYMNAQKILERLIHRTVCPCCKAVYNSRLKPPKRNGRCDKDGSALVQRSDDDTEVLQRRFDVFKRETEPLIEYYRTHRLFMMVNADRPAIMVTKEIVEGIASRGLLIDRS